MIVKSAALKTVCGPTSKLPNTGRPELAFAGRSNVGKSSLINALLNRKALARTSSQPGKTQTINFYEVNEELFLVDLPGYGYAAASREARASWGKMIEKYLRGSETLRTVFLLVDFRHAPTADDRQMFEWIREAKLSPVVIATKADKLKRSQLAKQEKLIRETLGMTKEEKLLRFSAQTKDGREEIWKTIEELL